MANSTVRFAVCHFPRLTAATICAPSTRPRITIYRSGTGRRATAAPKWRKRRYAAQTCSNSTRIRNDAIKKFLRICIPILWYRVCDHGSRIFWPEAGHLTVNDYRLQCSVDMVVCAEWHPLERNQIVSCGKGHVSFWSLDNGGMLYKRMGVFESRDKPRYVTCVAFNQNGDVLTGDSNGNIIVWARGSFLRQ